VLLFILFMMDSGFAVFSVGSGIIFTYEKNGMLKINKSPVKIVFVSLSCRFHVAFTLHSNVLIVTGAIVVINEFEQKWAALFCVLALLG
jgi:hypothetical protein